MYHLRLKKNLTVNRCRPTSPGLGRASDAEPGPLCPRCLPGFRCRRSLTYEKSPTSHRCSARHSAFLSVALTLAPAAMRLPNWRAPFPIALLPLAIFPRGPRSGPGYSKPSFRACNALHPRRFVLPSLVLLLPGSRARAAAAVFFALIHRVCCIICASYWIEIYATN